MSGFDERARTWDTPERRERAAEVAAAIREAVPLDGSMRAIDIGAGTGLLGLELASDVGDVVLTDPSEGMLDVAREKLPGSAGRVQAVRFDLLRDEPPGGPFDLAVSMLVLHHLPDTRQALEAVAGLLRPGGMAAIADLETEDGSFHDEGAEGIHHQGFDPAALAHDAEAAGFEAVRVGRAIELERDGRRYPVLLLVARRPARGG